jgi:hypothetical protein
LLKLCARFNIDVSRNKPKLLTLEKREGIDKAITMGCEKPAHDARPPPRTGDSKTRRIKPIEQVRKIRDEIKGRCVKSAERKD